MISTVDPDARHIHKNRTRHQDGFKAHVSFEPEAGLFTAVALTGGGGTANHEAAVADGLPGAEDGQLTVLGDTAYGTGELREHLQASGHLAVIKPPPLPRAIPGGFTTGDFTIGHQASTVTCPAGCDLRRGAAVGVSVWVWGSRLALIGQRSVAQPAVAAHGTPAEGGRPRAPRSPSTQKCPSAPGRPWIGPSVLRDVDRRAQPAVRQWLVVESRNDMHMGMQGTALVPAKQIAVWGQQIVQRHPCLEQ